MIKLVTKMEDVNHGNAVSCFPLITEEPVV